MQVVKTKAYGKLSHLKYVIHTVGPIYIETDEDRSVFELTQTFYNCLGFAEKLNLKSITFPFISTGKNKQTNKQKGKKKRRRKK